MRARRWCGPQSSFCKTATGYSFQSLFIAGKVPASLVEAISSDGIDCDPDVLQQPEWAFQPMLHTQLLTKLFNTGHTLGEVVSGHLYRGLTIGLNEAFTVDQATCNRIVQDDKVVCDLVKPCVKGEDLRPWYQEDEGRWLIVIPAGWTRAQYGTGLSEVHAWQLFSVEHPTLAGHLQPFTDAARRRQDKGDYWWELRTCDYYAAFEQPKIFWPDIAKLPTLLVG